MPYVSYMVKNFAPWRLCVRLLRYLAMTGLLFPRNDELLIPLQQLQHFTVKLVAVKFFIDDILPATVKDAQAAAKIP